MSSAETYTTFEMEAALCVWEWINEVTIELPENTMKLDDWIELRSDVGSPELRNASMSLGRWCLEVVDICTKQERDVFNGHAYDFAVIPAIMSFARDIEGQPCYTTSELPNPVDVAPKVLKALGIHKPEHRPGYWKETSEEGLNFFTEQPVSEEYFPPYEAVSLTLNQDDLLKLNGLLLIASEARVNAEDQMFSCEFSSPLAHNVEVHSDAKNGFNSRHCIVRVFSSKARTSARFEAINKNSDDRLVSQELSTSMINELIRELKGHSEVDESYPVEDWRSEVANDETRLGYSDWLTEQIAS